MTGQHEARNGIGTWGLVSIGRTRVEWVMMSGAAASGATVPGGPVGQLPHPEVGGEEAHQSPGHPHVGVAGPSAPIAGKDVEGPEWIPGGGAGTCRGAARTTSSGLPAQS